MTQTVNLYKLDNKDKVRIWTIETNTDNKSYRTITGIVDGNLVTSEWTEVDEQNVGKSNYRDKIEQCAMEVKAHIIKKKKEGYYETAALAYSEEKIFKPMKAYEYDPKKLLNRPIATQAKLDGVRASFQAGKLFSYQNNEFVSVPHIVEAVKEAFELHFYEDDIIVDGELYNHSLKEDFNKIISLVKKTKPTKSDLQESKEIVQYHIFDAYFKKHPEYTFKQRFELLSNILANNKNSSIKLVKTAFIDDGNIKYLDNLFEAYVLKGYEGQMVRDSNGIYEQKRSRTIYKRKEFVDKEYLLIDVLEGVGNRSKQAGKVVCKMRNGETFKAGITGDENRRKDLLINKKNYIGKMATIKHFKQLTPDGKPRFPGFKAIRDYE